MTVMSTPVRTTETTLGDRSARSRFLRRVAVAVGLGVPGVLVAAGYGAYVAPPVETSVSPTVLFAAAAASSTLLLVASSAVGSFAASRVGLRSHAFARLVGDAAPARRLRAELPLAVGLGLLAGLAVLGGADLLAPFVPAALTDSGSATIVSVLAFAPVRFLYGGITEELLVRFGLLSGIAALATRLVGRRGGAVSAPVMWGAVVAAALLFGLGHLPATAAVVDLTPAVVLRALLLNGLAGIVFGWLYWRRSLEAAMVAHVSFHLVLLGVSVLAVL
jgi:hypothetical protein